jgi:hypothetical protein
MGGRHARESIVEVHFSRSCPRFSGQVEWGLGRHGGETYARQQSISIVTLGSSVT